MFKSIYFQSFYPIVNLICLQSLGGGYIKLCLLKHGFTMCNHWFWEENVPTLYNNVKNMFIYITLFIASSGSPFSRRTRETLHSIWSWCHITWLSSTTQLHSIKPNIWNTYIILLEKRCKIPPKSLGPWSLQDRLNDVM